MKAWVVIPTLDGRERLLRTLESLDRQTTEAGVVVVDNASTDGTAAAVAERFPEVRVVRNERNLGFGAAVNRAALELDGDLLVLVNNDVVCEPDFVERITQPFADPAVGMVAGVLLQASAPGLVDSAGIDLDTTLGSWDHLWNRPVAELDGAADPIGPCGGAAAYRLAPFQELGGFDETLFAYWEDVDLALRFREAGWRCVLAADARALHEHGQTVGAGSPGARRLEAFGRGYVLAKYRVGEGNLLRLAKIAALDWPVLAVHLVARREAGPTRERLRARTLGLSAPAHRPPLELATVSFGEALRRQADQLRLRFSGGLPAHFTDGARAPRAGTPETPGSGRE
ncbi:MAG TPA: glycosyltransferase family 2 protein [Gaiellaceae bacterium]|jgi:GT2 family glycosyltransferase